MPRFFGMPVKQKFFRDYNEFKELTNQALDKRIHELAEEQVNMSWFKRLMGSDKAKQEKIHGLYQVKEALNKAQDSMEFEPMIKEIRKKETMLDWTRFSFFGLFKSRTTHLLNDIEHFANDYIPKKGSDETPSASSTHRNSM